MLTIAAYNRQTKLKPMNLTDFHAVKKPNRLGRFADRK